LSILKVAWPLGLNNLLVLASLRFELLALFILCSETETGLFGAALSVIAFLVSIPAAIAAGAMPALTREALSTGTAVRKRTAHTAALLAVPAAAGLALVARDVLLLVDARYASAAPLLRILALAVVPLFMSGVLSYALIAAGAGQVLPRLTAWRLAVALLCASVLVPALGPVGAACGFVTSEVVLLFLIHRACRRAGFAIAIASPLAIAVALTLPMTCAVWLTTGALWVRLAAGILCYGATLALAFALWPRLRRA
jgi:O-antigen/teichoic acid export membrane protein